MGGLQSTQSSSPDDRLESLMRGWVGDQAYDKVYDKVCKNIMEGKEADKGNDVIQKRVMVAERILPLLTTLTEEKMRSIQVDIARQVVEDSHGLEKARTKLEESFHRCEEQLANLQQIIVLV